MSERCATCIFWQSEESDKAWHAQTALAELDIRDAVTHEAIDPQPFDLRYCASPKMRRYERPEVDGASTVDGSEYWSALVTGPQFGCIHHTRKP